jgi:hypothetical protein
MEMAVQTKVQIKQLLYFCPETWMNNIRELFRLDLNAAKVFHETSNDVVTTGFSIA